MIVKNIVDEDFINYKEASMFIATCFCDYKCCKEANIPITVCQNEPLDKQPNIKIDNQKIVERYINNPISKALVIGGKEPILDWEDLIDLIKKFRHNNISDPIIIYTGYNEYNEIDDKIRYLQNNFSNIIIKFGRYVPNQKAHFDEILGVNLASDNQYAKQIC